MSMRCDRCGIAMSSSFDREFSDASIKPHDGVGGHCPCCGDNLCFDCAKHWWEPVDPADNSGSICDPCYQSLPESSKALYG